MLISHFIRRLTTVLLCSVLFHHCQSRFHALEEEASSEVPARSEVSPLAAGAFGKQAWRDYFGVDVGEEPSLPSDIEEILGCVSPFTLDDERSPQRVRDNHLLVLHSFQGR